MVQLATTGWIMKASMCLINFVFSLIWLFRDTYQTRLNMARAWIVTAILFILASYGEDSVISLLVFYWAYQCYRFAGLLEYQTYHTSTEEKIKYDLRAS